MAWLEKFWFGCGHCHGPQECPLAGLDESSPNGSLRERVPGARLVPTSLAVFIIPLITAIAGAYMAGYWWSGVSAGSVGLWQVVGLVVGFVVGMGLAKLLVNFILRGTTSPGHGRDS